MNIASHDHNKMGRVLIVPLTSVNICTQYPGYACDDAMQNTLISLSFIYYRFYHPYILGNGVEKYH